MIKVEEIKEVYNFEPKYTFSQLEQNLPMNSKVFSIICLEKVILPSMPMTSTIFSIPMRIENF